MSPALRRKKAGGRRRGINPLWIAAVVVAGTVFVTYYAFHQGLPFVHSYTLYALTNNSVNVRTDSPVRIAGIDVGSVASVSKGPGQTSKIAFTLDSNGMPVHTDATLRIRDRLFLEGGYYLDLNPGSPSAPIVHDGFTIPLSNTTTVVQFYKVLSTFDAAARQNLDNILNTFNEGFSPNPGQRESDSGAGGLKAAVPQFTPVFQQTAEITRALRGTHAGDVERLLRSFSDVTSTLAGSSSQLQGLVSGLNSASSALASADGALAQSVSGLDQVLAVAPGSLSAVDRALPPLAKLGTALDPALKLAPPILDDVTSAVRQLQTIVSPAERTRLLTSLKATFEQFPTLLTQLGQAFPITKQVTDCLTSHITPILTSTVPDGILSTGRPVWQDFVHFLPGVAGASADFDANGPYTRVLVGAGTQTLEGLSYVPGIGQLVGSEVPGGGTVQGARPAWVGTLKPSVFRPDVPCSSDAVPSLAAPAAASDLAAAHTSAPAPLTSSTGLKALIAAARRTVGR
jgi:virulence factor Mce-like protein